MAKESSEVKIVIGKASISDWKNSRLLIKIYIQIGSHSMVINNLIDNTTKKEDAKKIKDEIKSLLEEILYLKNSDIKFKVVTASAKMHHSHPVSYWLPYLIIEIGGHTLIMSGQVENPSELVNDEKKVERIANGIKFLLEQIFYSNCIHKK